MRKTSRSQANHLKHNNNTDPNTSFPWVNISFWSCLRERYLRTRGLLAFVTISPTLCTEVLEAFFTHVLFYLYTELSECVIVF
jgi:hypothetical protein